MTTFQEYLNNEYPTQQDKEQIEEISSYGSFFKNVDGGELDLSDYPNLEEVYIWGKHLKTPLTKLRLGNHPNLTTLVCPHNQLTSLILSYSSCPSLTRLDCYDNPLTSLNVSDLSKLDCLHIADTNLDLDLDCLPDSISYFCCRGVKSIEQGLKNHGEVGDDNNLAKPLKRWKEVNRKAKIVQLTEEVRRLKEELNTEREEACEAMQAAQRWRERQIRELKEENDLLLKEKDQQIAQLQTENTCLRQQLTNLQSQEKSAHILQPTNFPSSPK